MQSYFHIQFSDLDDKQDAFRKVLEENSDETVRSRPNKVKTRALIQIAVESGLPFYMLGFSMGTRVICQTLAEENRVMPAAVVFLGYPLYGKPTKKDPVNSREDTLESFPKDIPLLMISGKKDTDDFPDAKKEVPEACQHALCGVLVNHNATFLMTTWGHGVLEKKSTTSEVDAVLAAIKTHFGIIEV